MNCRDFREIADTYLSDELLVETNHEVFRHLENCANCRTELSLRREVRSQLRSAVINAEESTINPIFANKLKVNLREQSQAKSWFNWRILAPILASLLIAVSLGYVAIYNKFGVTQFAERQHQQALKALTAHEDCGLYHLKEWRENADKVEASKTNFVRSLTDKETKVLEAHECEFAGKTFTHYVLQRGEKVFSVLKTESENQDPANSETVNSITSEKQNSFQVASFESKQSAIFVVSDMTEAENLSIARKLSDAI